MIDHAEKLAHFIHAQFTVLALSEISYLKESVTDAVESSHLAVEVFHHTADFPVSAFIDRDADHGLFLSFRRETSSISHGNVIPSFNRIPWDNILSI